MAKNGSIFLPANLEISHPSSVEDLLDWAVYFANNPLEEFFVAAFPGNRRLAVCRTLDHFAGKITKRVAYVPVGRLVSAGRFLLNGSAGFNVIAYSGTNRTSDDCDRFVSFARIAGNWLAAYPPAWWQNPTLCSAEALWMGALSLVAPTSSRISDIARGEIAFIADPWMATIAALRSWSRGGPEQLSPGITPGTGHNLGGPEAESHSNDPVLPQAAQGDLQKIELTNRQILILRTMVALKAFDDASRQPQRAIVARLDAAQTKVNFKNDFGDLKNHGLTSSRKGRDGGIWLTTEGISYISSRPNSKADFVPNGSFF